MYIERRRDRDGEGTIIQKSNSSNKVMKSDTKAVMEIWRVRYKRENFEW